MAWFTFKHQSVAANGFSPNGDDDAREVVWCTTTPQIKYTKNKIYNKIGCSVSDSHTTREAPRSGGTTVIKIKIRRKQDEKEEEKEEEQEQEVEVKVRSWAPKLAITSGETADTIFWSDTQIIKTSKWLSAPLSSAADPEAGRRFSDFSDRAVLYRFKNSKSEEFQEKKKLTAMSYLNNSSLSLWHNFHRSNRDSCV